MNARIKFYKTPFVFLGAALCLGLLFGELVPSVNEFSVVLAIASAVLFFIFYKFRNVVTLPFTLLIVFLLGIAVISESRKDFETLKPGESTRVGEVVDAEFTDATWKKVVVRVHKEKHKGGWESKNEKVLLYTQFQLKKGDVLLMNNELSKVQNAGNPGEFDVKSYWRNKNIAMMGFLGESEFTLLDYKPPGVISSFFIDIRNNLSTSIDEFLPVTEASIAKALLLGDKGDLSKETRSSFSSAGAMHVLAISGLHVGIIMYLLFFVFKRFSRWISRRWAVILSICFIWLFVGVTGASPSVVRSALMFSIILIGQQSGRSSSSMNTLFFSAFILLLIDPLLLFDIGFQLSYGAMLGIFLFYDRVRSLIRTNNKLLNTTWDGTAIGIAAQVFTIPLVLHYFHQFPNYFWLTNLGIMILAGLILAVGLLFFALKSVPILNLLLAWILSMLLLALLHFVGWVESLPAAVARGFTPGIIGILVFYVAVVALSWNKRKKWLTYSAVGALLITVSFWQWNRFAKMESNQLVFFNCNSPVIAVKNGDKIYGFYVDDNKTKAMRCFESYGTSVSGRVVPKQLKKGRTQLRGEVSMEIIRSEKFISINSDGKLWLVRTGYSRGNSGASEIIDMPYLQKIKGHYNLSKGALVVAL